MAEREILFRGKRTYNGKWVEGSLVVTSQGGAYIISTVEDKRDATVLVNQCSLNVDPETVGQFTGSTDKNGKKIFEGDIIEVGDNPNYGGVAKKRIGIFIVEFYKGCFMKRKNGTSTYYHFIPSDEHTIIGNIHDNPDMLRGGGNDG